MDKKVGKKRTMTQQDTCVFVTENPGHVFSNDLVTERGVAERLYVGFRWLREKEKSSPSY